ncbi:oxygen-dependent protoporphyrinogen oxidase [Microbacterium marinum]|uniref:Oxygen-dependent protoporphyrinogen oxidase n=1 Tax=Microbacterium marinum TaxID=421115 RepID=A0A7W7BQE9_9MICO|nr:FAD-dependent oxidoreductase [Microbacterium marinum]MBB4665986.1 oxygen-dependent protoporphyrinogen oxidase [Microbacterium marinum]
MTSDAPDLVSHARSSRVVVIGGGMAGLIAALECARVGMAVTVLESGDRFGGLVQAAELDGRLVDTAADGFRSAPGALADLIDELDLRGKVVPARDQDTWVAGAFGVAPLPRASILGIPANPFDDRTRRIVGWAGAWRAYVDRLRPPLTIGKTRSLGALVRARMGSRVADRMVAPLSHGIHGLSPELVDVDRAARGLNAALTRTGSLSGGVAQQLPDDSAADGDRPTRATLRGGMATLVDALVAHLTDLDVDLRLGATATALDSEGQGWAVTSTSGGESSRLPASAVIVATDEAAARRLLAAHVSGLDGAVLSPDDVDVATLLLDEPDLDRSPRGHAVYVVPGSAPAIAVVHASATWPHAAGDPHVVRVTLPASDATDAAVIAEATRAASEMLGVTIAGPRAAHRRRAPRALPGSALAPERDELEARLRAGANLGVVGAWIGGNGLARVVEDAKTEAERVRSELLWGPRAEDAPR